MNLGVKGSAILDYEDMDGVILYSKIANSNILSEIQGEKGSIIIDKINQQLIKNIHHFYLKFALYKYYMFS